MFQTTRLFLSQTRAQAALAITRTYRFQKLQKRDLAYCILLNRWCRLSWVQRYFATVSELGNGSFWIALIISIAMFAQDGARIALQLSLLALCSWLIYRTLKNASRRSRPLRQSYKIKATVAPLDEFSFPSGHTLHAVSLSIVAIAYIPMLAIVLIPFTLSTAVSRVVLGLHYPSDVLAASAIGSFLAWLSFLAGS
jgi:undecaprenyl-diphosphatase